MSVLKTEPVLRCTMCRKPAKVFTAFLPMCGGSHIVKPPRKKR